MGLVRGCDQPGDRLGNALGLVPHALQVDDDIHGRSDGAQVARCRLLRNDERETFLLDVEPRSVHRDVGDNDLFCHICVEGSQRCQRKLQLLLHQAAHVQNFVAQFIQFAFKVGA